MYWLLLQSQEVAQPHFLFHCKRQEGDFWQADHIVPVAEGGGECSLANLRTLCTPCHAEVRIEKRVCVWNATGTTVAIAVSWHREICGNALVFPVPPPPPPSLVTLHQETAALRRRLQRREVGAAVNAPEGAVCVVDIRTLFAKKGTDPRTKRRM